MPILAQATSPHAEARYARLAAMFATNEASLAAATPPTRLSDRIALEISRVLYETRGVVTEIEIFSAKTTGEYPVITAASQYDVSGLVADPNFSMSFEDAVAAGRRLVERTGDFEESDSDIAF